MNTITEEKIAAIRREKPRLGLIFGLLAGAGFALTAWGLDANQLAQAHAYLPWGKFIAGLVICLVVGGFTGWVASRLDSSLWAAFLWALVGCTFTIGLSWLAYKGFLSLFNWFYPDLASQMDYASNPAITLLTGIAVVASGILGIGVGIAQIIQVESALAGVNPFQRLVRLAMGALIFAIAGAISSSLVQTKLAEPVLQVNDALVYAREHRGQILEIKEARKYGLTALRALGDLQYQPYRLVVSSYDEYLSMIWVMLDFGDVQTRCSVLEKTLSYCESPPEIAASSSSGNSVSIPGPQPTGIPSAVPTSTPAGSSTDTASGEQVNPPENIPPPTDPALDSVHLQTTLPELAGRVPDVLNRYQLDVSITPEQLSFQGNLVLDYTNLESTALGTLFFRLLPNGQRSYGNGSLSVDNVQVNGENQAVNLSLEDTILEVTLDPALEPGASATIAMNFQGEVPEDFGGEDSGGYGIFNFSAEVMALASWYPILAVYDEAGWHLDPVSYIGDSVYSDMADYEVEIELPADQVLVSTGVARQTGAGGDRQLLVVESGPVRDFFMILSPRFRSLQSRFGGTRVNSYYLPGHENGGQRALEVAVLSIETFNRQFGAYPYTELDVVDAPMQNAGGVEYPGIVLVGDSQYTDYNETGFAVTTAHEVAHQWWYNLVGNDVFAEPWLDEALASYTSGIYLEAAQGKPALDGLMSHYQERYQRSLDSSGDHPINESLAYFESQTNPNAYGGIVYAKGALFFDAVRQEIGDEAFFAAMRSYFDTYRYGIAAGKDLLAAFEAAAGRPLAELFQTWNVASQP